MSNPEVTWVVLEGDGLAVCLRCGDRTPLARLPMTITDFVKRLRAVSAMHAGCVEHVHSALCPIGRTVCPSNVCMDERHEIPCPLPCSTCDEECYRG